MRRDIIARHLETSLRQSLDAPTLRVVELRGRRPPEDERREPWITVKYGPASADDWFGVVPAEARFERGPGTPVETLPLVVKINPGPGVARTLIPWIVEQQKIAFDRPYWAYRCAAEMDQTGPRESALYTHTNTVPSVRRVLPRCYGVAADEAGGEFVLFLEFVTDAARLDATGAFADWPMEAIDAAVRAAAGWHAAFWGIGAEAAAWMGPRVTTSDMLADEKLWRGLLDAARARFPDIVTEAAWRRRHALIETIADWHPTKDHFPATLAHNDFNQRNVGFRPDALVLDWELVTHNVAHRDLVEMLTFVLPPDVERTQVERHVEAHRAALVEAGIPGIDRDAWIELFRCEIKVEAINRIALQLLFGMQFPLDYLARINATIERLLDLYG
jgi:hypothetical protein